jgi:hypothetical protein
LFVFVIGIDPDKGSHSAAVIDADERLVDELAMHPMAASAIVC